MNRDEIRDLLQKLAGQAAPLNNAPENLVVLGEAGIELGYSQLNELLLLFGFDRISHAFFRYLLDGKTEYELGQAFTTADQLRDGVNRFCRLAILLYGNVKFAFKSLSTNAALLSADLESDYPIEEEIYESRHQPVLSIHSIEPHDAYLTGYLIEAELKKSLAANPDDEIAKSLEVKRQQIVTRATANQNAYLASDHLDVYVATSMRERHEFSAIKRLTSTIFQDPTLADLKLRWFDPTQAYCPNRVDKGLAEALMLRRASCTLYLVQESDTLGKDSELASTLAQGKPVVAYIPEVSDEFFLAHLDGVQEANPERTEPQRLLDQLRIYEPGAAWSDETIRGWCRDPANVNPVVLRPRLQDSMKRHYDKRAHTLRDSHPLGIQVNLQTGVGNGVLVVRTVPDCARIIRNILLRRLELRLDENDRFVALREQISGCIFRIMTKDAKLRNTFWNFYLDPAE